MGGLRYKGTSPGKTGDLETLQNLYAAIHDEKYIPDELICEYESLKNQIEYFKGQISLLLEKITVIQMDFPFTIREKLNNDEWLKSEHLIKVFLKAIFLAMYRQEPIP